MRGVRDARHERQLGYGGRRPAIVERCTQGRLPVGRGEIDAHPGAAAVHVGAELADPRLPAHGGHHPVAHHQRPDVASLRLLDELLHQDLHPQAPERFQDLLHHLLGLGQDHADPLGTAHQLQDRGRASHDGERLPHLRGMPRHDSPRDVEPAAGQELQRPQLVPGAGDWLGVVDERHALHVELVDHGQAELSGGRVSDDSMRIFDFSRLIITGGDIGPGFMSYGSSEVFIHGSNFQIDGAPVGYGPLPVPMGNLTGDLLLGGQINSLFAIFDNSSVTLVPEPASTIMLALGGVALILRRKALDAQSRP